MRYEKGHRDVTRRRIVDVAAKQFREGGVAAVGLAGLMADAGLTNGAFYTHFDSKEDLVREALLEAIQKTQDQLQAGDAGRAGLTAFIRTYLSPRHRDNPGRGCASAALLAEVARHPSATRSAFTGKIAGFLDAVAARIPAGTAQARKRKAWTLFAMMLGTVQLARAVNDKALSDEILSDGLESALDFAGLAT